MTLLQEKSKTRNRRSIGLGSMVTIARSAVNKFLRLLPLCLLVASCGSDVPFPRCVSADNFNSNTTASVSAYYGPGNVEAFKADDGQTGNASTPGANKHMVRWKDTGFVTDGEEIVISIQGAWVPWAKHGEKHSSPLAVNTGISRPVDLNDEFYDSVVDVGRVCGPYEERKHSVSGCELNCKHIPATDDENTGRYGRPCWLEKGYGAYLLFKRPEDPDPNSTLDLIEYPVSPTTHLGHAAAGEGKEVSYSSGGKIFGSDCKSIDPQRGWKIYVKILDNYYYDNAGGYSLEFKKGVINGKGVRIFEYVRKLVRDELDKAGKQIFGNIVENKGFRTFAFAVITLFLVISALVYLLGMVQAPLADTMVRILKIILVILLVSPGSWDFFHNHLLKLFTGGVDQIIALVNSHAAGQKFKSDAPFDFMDVMIVDKIFSTVVWEAKARALIMADFASIFALLIIIIAVICYVALCLYGFIIYLTAFVGITFLIALMPIMFIGILFSRFRSLFDGWLTQCISFSMQAILMFTLIAMFGSLIMHYYYRIFGFTACYNEVLHIKFYALGHRIIDQKYYEWTPGQKYDPILIGWSGSSRKGEQTDSGTSARYVFTGGGAIIKVPPDYKDRDFRYVDFPFLDPDAKSSAPPGGVSPIKSQDGEKLESLTSLTNSLIASARGTSTARLVEKIKKELEERVKDKTVTSETKDEFIKVIEEREKEDAQGKKDVKQKYTDLKFKEKLVTTLTTKLIGTSTVLNPTSAKDLEEQHDYNIIKDLKKGYIVMWPEVFGLILVAFLVWQMRAFVQHVAVVLAGGSILSRTVASMYSDGFVRIFSHIPVVGTLIDRVDRGIDGLRVLMRAKAGDLASTATRMPENLLKRVPIVGGVLGTAAHGVRSLSSALTASHTEEDLYSMRSISPRFDYARAWVGAHLGYSPLDAMKYLGGHALGRITGSETEGLMHNIVQDRAAFLSSLEALTIGVEKYKPSGYAPAQKDDDANPFVRPDLKDGTQGADTPSSRLFDSDGKLHVDRENFWDAVDTLHGLGALRARAEDPEVRDRIDEDMNKLRSEITTVAQERPGEVPELAEFVAPSGDVDFARLMEHSLARHDATRADGTHPAEPGHERGAGGEQGADDEAARAGVSEMVDDVLQAPDTVDSESGDSMEERSRDTESSALRDAVDEQREVEAGDVDEVQAPPEEEGTSRTPTDRFEDVLSGSEGAATEDLAGGVVPEGEVGTRTTAPSDVQGEPREAEPDPDYDPAPDYDPDPDYDPEPDYDPDPDYDEFFDASQDMLADGEEAAAEPAEGLAVEAVSEDEVGTRVTTPSDAQDEPQEVEPRPDYDPDPDYDPTPDYDPDPDYDPTPDYDPDPDYDPTPDYDPDPDYDPTPDYDDGASDAGQGAPAGDEKAAVEGIAAGAMSEGEVGEDRSLPLTKSDRGRSGTSSSEGGRKSSKKGYEEDEHDCGEEQLGYGDVHGDDYEDAKESGPQVGEEVYQAYTSKNGLEGEEGSGEGEHEGASASSGESAAAEAATYAAYSGGTKGEGGDLQEVLDEVLSQGIAAESSADLAGDTAVSDDMAEKAAVLHQDTEEAHTHAAQDEGGVKYDVTYSAAEGACAWAEATEMSGYQDDTTTISDEQPEEAVEGATEVAEAKDTEQQDKGATDSDDADDEFEDAVDVAEAGTEADVTLATLGSHRPEIGGKVASASQSTGKHTGSGGASRRQQQEERRRQMSALQERIVELQKALDSPNVTETDKQSIEAELSTLKAELDGLGGSSQ
ncbi:type IV secretion system protein [Anaplasma marginale]|uniref:type IV secretion system protein n=1 Tax=Anaplasma marginale TaxID=770 RepID=UPI0005B2F4ED|nr:type IV secretion system protein [Anaplasma marginale]